MKRVLTPRSQRRLQRRQRLAAVMSDWRVQQDLATWAKTQNAGR